MLNRYMDEELMASRLEKEGHRAIVGGMWDVIGSLQCSWLVQRGMKPSEYVLDIGCGSLRGGVQLVQMLEAGHYYGIDISQQLLLAGYAQEIEGTSLEPKLPRDHLFVTPDFTAPFGKVFDRCLAISLFTHLPLDMFTYCLKRIGPVMRSGSVFHASVFEGSGEITWPSGITTYDDRDPFHFSQGQLEEATPKEWKFHWIGNWGHPRSQQMIELIKI